MFGGLDYFKERMMIGMIGDGVFRLKADDSNQADFEAKGMTNYAPKSDSKGMPYW